MTFAARDFSPRRGVSDEHIPQWICEERATKSGRKRPAALRVAPNLACGFVARRLQPHGGDAPSSRLATGQIGRNERHRIYASDHLVVEQFRNFWPGARPFPKVAPRNVTQRKEHMLPLGKYSFGMGDRFAHQARAQLRACIKAAEQGVEVIPVWNKSNREHVTVGSEPSSVRSAADAAVRELKWKKLYHVDADHIRLETVDRFIPHSDFFTVDVADFIGRPAGDSEVKSFVDRHGELVGRMKIPGIEVPLEISRADVGRIVGQYLCAVQEAGRIYRHIEQTKGAGFITEISMDETDRPQTPPELLVILAAIADERIPVQTVAPKFTGRFNKGVDYVGDVAQFEKEFNADLAVIAFAVEKYRLPRSEEHTTELQSPMYPVCR